MKCSLGISNFLEEISSLSHSVVFLYFFALIAEEGFLISPDYSLELCKMQNYLEKRDDTSPSKNEREGEGGSCESRGVWRKKFTADDLGIISVNMGQESWVRKGCKGVE